jgi:argininosuccinate lyase/amino-acid N-acetyltransferase
VADSGTPRAVWRGRLATALDPRAQALNDSLPVDRRLWPEELALSRSYAAALATCGVLDPAEARALAAACDTIEVDLEAGRLTLEGEDIHSAIEAELTRRCGDPGRKLHTGRSRNDQVSTLMRLRVMRLCDIAVEQVRELERALVHQAERAGSIAVAAYTHLQPAQPVLLAHWWLAHVSAFERDEARFQTAREAADLMPLGSGAVAGTPLVYDRAAVATSLGFSRLAENSMDAVGDRDFVLDYLSAALALGVHLSRLAEDLVLWCSPAFGWFRAPDGFSTGSSLLPQKRNPDVFELTRGKSARLIAGAQRLAIVLKGLPTGYQKDLQEDKETLFDAADTLAGLLAALAPAIAALEPDESRMRATLTPDLLAVELADALVELEVPFRDAHAAVGALWALAERRGVTPADLPEDERLAISPHFTAEQLGQVTVETALARRDHAPGTGPRSVARQLRRAAARLGLAAGDPEVGDDSDRAPRPAAVTNGTPVTTAGADAATTMPNGITLRRAKVEDVPGIAGVMADYVNQGVLLPRPISELFQCVREFHVAVRGGEVVACAALRLLWDDLGEVRSLAVRPDHHGLGLGGALVQAVLEDARALGLPRVIALTREVSFFERSGFAVVSRDTLPRKVWTDCVRCPRRHACDEVAVVLDLVPGASAAAAASGRSWMLPIPHRELPESELPVIS